MLTDDQAREQVQVIVDSGGVDLLATMVSEQYSARDRVHLVERMIDHGLQESPGDERWLELKRQLNKLRVT